MTTKSSKPQGPDSSRAPAQQQAQSGAGRQYGEGNYKAAREYNASLKDHVEHHDIEKEARDAAPRTAAEEKAMEEAERIGRSKARGEDAGSLAADAENQRDLEN